MFVKFLQNHQVMVGSLDRCYWPGRRVPQRPNCWSSCNFQGKKRKGGENDGKEMVSDIEGVQSLEKLLLDYFLKSQNFTHLDHYSDLLYSLILM